MSVTKKRVIKNELDVTIVNNDRFKKLKLWLIKLLKSVHDKLNMD